MESPLREKIEELNNAIEQNRPDQTTKSAYHFEVVDPASLKLLDKNARYMSQDMFQTLVNNVKKDGGLTSLPLCCKEPDGGRLVLSGNHRVQAAVHAGIKEIIILVISRELTHQEKVAIQLSHNAIEGKDDLVVLKDLWNEIEDIDLKMYAGLDSEVLKELDKMQFVSISEAAPDFKQMVLLFLPEEIEMLTQIMQDADCLFTGDVNYVTSRKHYDEVFKTIIEVKDKYGIVNNPTAIMKIVELARTQMESLEASQPTA